MSEAPFKNSAEIIKFWFEDITPKQWFKKDDQFDEMLKQRAAQIVQQALNGQLDSWAETPQGAIALVLLLDQFTRNISRNTPMAFAGDEMALAISLKASSSDWFKEQSEPMRIFLLMPMMHSEDIAIQDNSLLLFKEFTNEDTYSYAVNHRNVVAKFGKFPHRDKILGRPSSAEEIEFLKQPGSSF